MIRVPILFLLLFPCALAQQDSSIHKILIDQFRQTAMDSAPHSLGTTIVMRLSLRKLQAIEPTQQASQVGTFYVEEEYSWDTRQQTWDPSEYGDVDSVKLPAAHMWTPDVILDNPHSFSPGDTVRSALYIHSDGMIKWTDLRIVTVPCFHKPGQYSVNPMYYINFIFKYRILSFDSSEYDLDVPESGAFDVTSYVPAYSHGITQMTARRHEMYKPCCLETFPNLIFNVTMRSNYE